MERGDGSSFQSPENNRSPFCSNEDYSTAIFSFHIRFHIQLGIIKISLDNGRIYL